MLITALAIAALLMAYFAVKSIGRKQVIARQREQITELLKLLEKYNG